jgi:hypothetical protein
MLRYVAGGASALLLVGALAANPASAANGSGTRGLLASTTVGADGTDVGYAADKPLCSTKVVPGHANCFAMGRVPVKPARTDVDTAAPSCPGQRTGIGLGKACGYTPDDIAAAYEYNPSVQRSNQTVALVDWFDDPKVAANLAQFDSFYEFPKETASSFRKVNQTGAKSPLPSSAHGKSTAAEIALDVESVRAVCHTCRILLVEAKSSSLTNLAAAENTAVRLGATEVSDSFGAPEGGESKTIRNAFNHPGVVLTASTGDDGWFGWDFANDSDGADNAPNFPSTAPTVVSVGGTQLQLNSNGSIGEQTIWNENGKDDSVGLSDGAPDGAGGGGCSTEFTAPAWQSHFAGYSAAHCGGKRLAADVSAIADPDIGLDVFDTWGTHDHGWVTIGGTSLSSPVIAAMFALAGGSGGTVYPAASIYENAKNNPSRVFDVVPTNDGLTSGNGFCGGDATSTCGNDVSTDTHGGTHNPNALGAGEVDCSFPRNDTNPAKFPPLSPECNTTTGYDGPSGVGTPLGTGLFSPTSPAVSLRSTTKVARLHKVMGFTAVATERLAGQHVTSVTFTWGDGHSTSGTSLKGTHAFAKKGRYDIDVVVTDSAGGQSRADVHITVGEPSAGKPVGPKTVKHGHKAKFHISATDPNAGGKIKKITWSWGDHHSSRGKRVSHRWHAKGKYRITVTVTDTTGVRTKFVRHVRVK